MSLIDYKKVDWTWQPAQKNYPPAAEIARIQRCSIEQAQGILDREKRCLWFLNDIYEVTVCPTVFGFDTEEVQGVPVIHLSIKRRDKETIHDWRHLQRIKNEICGSEFEAMELYPSESRLVDAANQYHLWVFFMKGYSIPIGWTERLVQDDKDAIGTGAKQRAFEQSETVVPMLASYKRELIAKNQEFFKSFPYPL